MKFISLGFFFYLYPRLGNFARVKPITGLRESLRWRGPEPQVRLDSGHRFAAYLQSG